MHPQLSTYLLFSFHLNKLNNIITYLPATFLVFLEASYEHNLLHTPSLSLLQVCAISMKDDIHFTKTFSFSKASADLTNKFK